MIDPHTDPTPIAPGSWVTVVFYQNPLGAVDMFRSWTTIAQAFVAAIPPEWTPSAPALVTGISTHGAIELNVPNYDETVSSITAMLDTLSAEVGIRSVTPAQGTPSFTDAANAANGATSWVDRLLENPATTLQEAAGNLAIVVGAAAVVYVIIATRAWKFLPRVKR